MHWSEWLQSHESSIRLGSFACVFLLMAGAEVLAPRRTRRFTRRRRWPANLLLVGIYTLLIRVLFPTAAVGVAAYTASVEGGVLRLLELPFVLAVAVSVIILDLVIYLQHVMVHAVPALWRLHRVHHADLDYDVTTGARFHPLEILLSMLIKFAAIVLLGPPVIAVILFEVILNGMAMFNHANVRLPGRLDALLRLFVVTPDMHRVHHSVEDDEANSNFGFNLSLWDRLFGTYRAQPRGGHEAMVIGIHGRNDPAETNGLRGMLMMPFIGGVQGYAINRRQWGEGRQTGQEK